MKWNLDLRSLLNGVHLVETAEGAVRTGQITNIEWRTKTINARIVQEPVYLELNGDASDLVEWALIIRVERTEGSG